MSIHHVTISTVGRLALARSETERRALVRAFAWTGRERLLMFDLVDDHVHAGIRGERPRLIARDLRRALLAKRPGLRLDPPHLKLVDSRDYLRGLVTYLLTQATKHDLGVPDATWTGSCFQDLAGVRLLRGYSMGPLRAELPRLKLRELFQDVGLEQAPLRPASDDQLRAAGATRVVDLAAGVFCVGPRLAGRSAPVVAARVLASTLGVKLGFSRAQLAPLLAATPQAVGRLAKRALDPAALRALRLRFDLEERVWRRGRGVA
jgi:hypothetical protein